MQKQSKTFGFSPRDIAQDQWKKLTEDVLFIIFTTLPMQTLGLCSCVCKSWRSIIKNPLFVKNHLLINNNAIPDETRYHMTFDYTVYPEFKLFSFNSSETLGEPHKLRPKISSKGKKYLVGCSSGLICILDFTDSGHSYNVLLWNPVIKKIKIITKTRAKRSDVDRESVILGFGFVPQTSDFKVVKIEYYKSSPDSPKAEVYSLVKKTWKTITEKTPKCKVVGNQGDQSPNAFVRGCAHWIANRGQKGKDNLEWVILCFDMTAEEFREIKMPDMPAKCIPKYEDSLGYNSWEIQIWVMKEYGMEKSWSRLYNLEGCPATPELINEGRILLIVLLTGSFVYYDYGADKGNRFVVDSEVSSVFKGSLALLNDGTNVF